MNVYQQNIYRLFGPKCQDYWPHTIDELPNSYFDLTLMMMPVEPGRAYVYWDLWDSSSPQADTLQNQLDVNLGKNWRNKGPLLKIYEMAESNDIADALVVSEHLVKCETYSLFFDLDWQSRRYQAEMGFVDRNGEFLAIILSNTIGTRCISPLVNEGGNICTESSFYLPNDTPSQLISARRQTIVNLECENKFRAGISSPLPSSERKT